MSRLTTTLGIAGAVIALGAVVVGTLVYRQVNPPLPLPLAKLAGTPLTTALGSPILLGQAAAPAAITIVSFWATWCIPCRAEATALARLRQRYAPSDLAIVYLNVDATPDPTATARFLQETHAEGLPVFYAGPADWLAVTGSKTMVLPRTYIFDHAGSATAALAGFDRVKLDDSIAATRR